MLLKKNPTLVECLLYIAVEAGAGTGLPESVKKNPEPLKYGPALQH